MQLSGDDFRLVFSLALIPAFIGIAVFAFFVRERDLPRKVRLRLTWRRTDLRRLPPLFWRIIGIAGALAMARFSHAFLLLKSHHAGMDAAFVPMTFVLIYLVYSAAAYPFGVLADWFDRRLQLALGIAVLVCAQVLLAMGETLELTLLGAGLWGLQMAVTQGLLAAAVAGCAPRDMRGTAFGTYELMIGVATFTASGVAGLLWSFAGPIFTFGAGAFFAAAAAVLLLFTPLPRSNPLRA
jgi:MFS family permease